MDVASSSFLRTSRNGKNVDDSGLGETNVRIGFQKESLGVERVRRSRYLRVRIASFSLFFLIERLSPSRRVSRRFWRQRSRESQDVRARERLDQELHGKTYSSLQTHHPRRSRFVDVGGAGMYAARLTHQSLQLSLSLTHTFCRVALHFLDTSRTLTHVAHARNDAGLSSSNDGVVLQGHPLLPNL